MIQGSQSEPLRRVRVALEGSICLSARVCIMSCKLAKKENACRVQPVGVLFSSLILLRVRDANPYSLVRTSWCTACR